jgi:hypothetical protein
MQKLPPAECERAAGDEEDQQEACRQRETQQTSAQEVLPAGRLLFGGGGHLPLDRIGDKGGQQGEAARVERGQDARAERQGERHANGPGNAHLGMISQHTHHDQTQTHARFLTICASRSGGTELSLR